MHNEQYAALLQHMSTLRVNLTPVTAIYLCHAMWTLGLHFHFLSSIL